MRNTLHVGRRVFHTDNVLYLGQACHRLDGHVDGRATRNVVDENRQPRRFRDGAKMEVQALLSRPVVVRRHDESRIGTQLLRELGHFDRVLG